MAEDYAYINARIRVLRSELLMPDVYERLLECRDPGSLRELLETTLYQKGFKDISFANPAGLFEEGLREEWLRIVSRLYKMTSGKPRKYLEILFGRWEIESLKSILRGKKVNASVPEILSTVFPIGWLDPPAAAELARQPSVQAIVDLLTVWRSPYAVPLKKALKEKKELQDLEAIELSLDRYYFKAILSKLEGGDPNADLLHEIIRRMADKVNLLTVLKISRGRIPSGFDFARYFIEGGKYLSLPLCQTLIRAEGRGEVIGLIEKTPYGRMLEGLKQETEGMFSFLKWESGLDQMILDETDRMSFSDPLGIGLMAGYLFRKHHEITNLRLILRSRIYEIHAPDVRNLLVV